MEDCKTNNQIADALAKPLEIDKFKEMKNMLNILNLET